MTESDVAELIGYLLSAWAIGFMSGYILRVFARGSRYIK